MSLRDFPPETPGIPPTQVRVDPQLNFPLENTSVGGPELNGTFFARWTGKLRVSVAGEYTFYLAGNDAARLSLNGAMVVQAKAPVGTTPFSLASAEATGRAMLSANELQGAAVGC